jgi:tetratricopeptide (TPR) repeat protein
MVKKGWFLSLFIVACLIFGWTSKVLALDDNSVTELSNMFKEKKYEEVVSRGSELIKSEPEDPFLNDMIGRSLFSLANGDPSKYKEALSYLEKAIQKKYDVVSFIDGAICYYKNGNSTKARVYLNQAISASMNKNSSITENTTKLIKRLNLVPYFDDWRTVETEHFIFHFHPSFNDKLIREFTKTREVAYSNINDFFKVNLPKKIDFYVWDSNESALGVLGMNLGFADPEYCIINSKYNQSPGHEMAHVISDNLYPNIKSTDLINEGTATYFNQLDSNRRMKKFIIRIIFNSNMFYKYVPVVDLWKDNSLFRKAYPEGTAYTIGDSFVELLIKEGGTDKYKQLLQDQSYENARKIYGDKLDDIVRKFDNRYKVNYAPAIIAAVIILSFLILIFGLMYKIIKAFILKIRLNNKLHKI